MAQAKKAGTEVAKSDGKKESLVIVTDQVPDYIKRDGQRGSEGVTNQDLVIPRLEIVQALSPAVKRNDPGFIKGAEVGMLTNSVTRELYGDKVMVVPLYFVKAWLVWKERKDKNGKSQEGGFFGSFNTEEEAQQRVKKEDPDGRFNVVATDTPQHFCLLLNMSTGEVDEIMVSMAKSKAKISRQWNSLIRAAGGDRFSRVYELGTVAVKRGDDDYVNYSVAARGFPNKTVYARAEETYKKIAAGERKVVMDVTGMDVSDDEEDHGKPTKM